MKTHKHKHYGIPVEKVIRTTNGKHKVVLKHWHCMKCGRNFKRQF